MIEEVKDFVGDVKDGVGKKGLIVIGVGAALFGLYHYLKASEPSGEVYYTPTGVTGYPSLDKNADVVIDSVNKTIEGSLMEMIGALGESESNVTGAIADARDDINDTTKEGFDAIGGYVQEGLDKMNDLSQKVDSIDTTPVVQYVPQYIPVKGDTITNITDSIVGAVVNGSTAENVTGTVNMPTTNTTTTTTTAAKKPAAKTTTATKTTTTTPKTETYTYTSKSGLNTGTSIVDALKAAGGSGSMAERQKIAAANGIKNYTGTAAQNNAMLQKLKEGNLVKPNGTTSVTTTTVKSTTTKSGTPLSTSSAAMR